jgi:hypothetical protein
MTKYTQLQSLIAKFVSKGHTYECARLIVRYFGKEQIKFDNSTSQSSKNNKSIQYNNPNQECLRHKHHKHHKLPQA